jgi:hypothetical protein
VQGLSLHERLLVPNLVLVDYSSLLIESQIPAILDDLKQKNIKVIALTAAMTGTLKGVQIEQKRCDELKRLGIDFSSSFESHSSFYLHELKSFQGRFPMFYHGILLTNGDARKGDEINNKGEVLIAFLKRINWFPKKILFVDDKIDHLKSVEKSLTDLDPSIAFTGVEYSGASKIGQAITEEEFEKKWQDLSKQAKALSQAL